MVEEDKEAYKGQGLRGALWTLAGTSIGGLATGLLGGGLNAVNAMNNCNPCNATCSSNQYINRYELEMENKIVAKDAEISLLKSNIYTDQKLADVFERLSNRIGLVEANVNQQAVVNATTISTIQCMQNQISQLQSITKLVVPNSSVCPGWGDVAITPTTTTATATA